MEHSMQQVSGAGFPFKVNEKEYLLYPLSLADIDLVTNWVRSRIIEMAYGAITEDTPKEIREQIRDDAFKKAAEVSFDNDTSKIASTPAGANFLFKVCSKSKETIQLGENDLLRFIDTFLAMHGLSELSEKLNEKLNENQEKNSLWSPPIVLGAGPMKLSKGKRRKKRTA